MGMRKGDCTWISCGSAFTSDPTVSERHLLRLVHAVLDNHVFVVFSWGQDLYYDLSSGLQQKLAGSLATFNVLHFVSTASLMILQSSVAAVSTYLVRSSNVLEVVHLMHSDIHLVLDNEVKELIASGGGPWRSWLRVVCKRRLCKCSSTSSIVASERRLTRLRGAAQHHWHSRSWPWCPCELDSPD
ncbi:hypothetical protein KCU93_g152, partial [Aureobasidium melanogenum]